MIRKERKEIKKNLKGGPGELTFYHILETEELYGHGTMYARVVMPPKAGIGVHTHVHNTEPYYILSGHGDFTDADGTVHKVGPGDCCIIEPGQSHGLSNPYDEDLVFMALIYNE
ncbi:cupin domain-containing protein [Catenisphaera adipataccumulans]|jgi:mannose-6-phosphate isomerase-like protein (cupin superfamily)|uniref:Mannose-6-phosphate isomerase-like protein (Cupin superfamily) n=1 Tax=Catenisphaera adipataccumulans TaxID=700500 RepID=A0A7W8CXE2_9FIRM|nr:cupin domain-containing protein [Catenisphaera adipataccumulans]MBB5183091.1 mannose-6-phosphate isomerase-like protein (cupin superfamily) [Catenisphaera adipataccumulans]